MQTRFAHAFALCCLTVAPAVARAGPPLICWPISIGGAASLPMGVGGEARADYDRTRLADDTAALLGPQTRALVRMETLRRAAVYAASDDAAATRLFEMLRARSTQAVDARAQALARFDLGYEAAAYRQALLAAHSTRAAHGNGVQLPKGVQVQEDGYELVEQALESLRPNPEVEYAAALVALGSATHRALADRHVKLAADGAAAGSDLARTLAAHARLWGGRVSGPASAAVR